MSASVSLVCSKDLRDYVIFVQINGALEDEPEGGDSKDTAGQIVSADEHLVLVSKAFEKAFELIVYRVPRRSDIGRTCN